MRARELLGSYVGLARTVYIHGAYTVFWQGNHQIYGHVWCIYTVLANPILLWSCVEEGSCRIR